MTASPDSLIFRGTLILPDRLLNGGALLCSRGRIVALGTASQIGHVPGAKVVDADDGYVCPGFVDLHVHGGAGADYMDGTLDAFRAANRAHARHGTTTIFPTTTTGSLRQIDRMLRTASAARDSWQPDHGARLPGVHFYGPYFAPDKVGCHSKEGRRDPLPPEYEQALQSGIVKIATCAAELPGAEAFYRAAVDAGCLVTCGHSNASWTEMQRAFDAGMRHVDHFWCAMSSVASLRTRLGTPMQAGMEQFVLMNRAMSTEVIADGFHLAAELLEFAWRMIGPERLCLVTDSSRAMDCAPGRYRFGPIEDGAWFEHDGHVGRAGDSLASSSQGMDHMVRTMKRHTSAPLHEVVRMATLTPAQRAGVAADVGSLEVHKRADLLVMNAQLAVQQVYLQQVRFNAPEILSPP
jgi:N-acetylglucosamine-6-phosphate deacetylase